MTTNLHLAEQPDEPETCAAENLKPGQFLAADMLTTGRPAEVLFVDTYPREGNAGRETLIVHRPVGCDWSITSTVGGNRWFQLATERELAEFRAGADRAQKIDDIRAYARWLEDNPGEPVGHGFGGLVDVEADNDADAVARVRAFAVQYGAEVRDSLDDRTSARLRFGQVEHVVVAWHRDGRPAEPQPLTPAPFAKHYDASYDDNEYACACGLAFDGLAVLKQHISAANADPTGLAYSRPADGDEPQPVAGREPMHTGGLTEQGLVDETDGLTGAAITEACVITGWGGVCMTHKARHIASGEDPECGCPVYPFAGRGDSADTIVDHREGCGASL